MTVWIRSVIEIGKYLKVLRFISDILLLLVVDTSINIYVMTHSKGYLFNRRHCVYLVEKAMTIRNENTFPPEFKYSNTFVFWRSNITDSKIYNVQLCVRQLVTRMKLPWVEHSVWRGTSPWFHLSFCLFHRVGNAIHNDSDPFPVQRVNKQQLQKGHDLPMPKPQQSVSNSSLLTSNHSSEITSSA